MKPDQTPRLIELADVPGLELTHALGDDQRDCWACTMSQDENAHTFRDYLPFPLAFLQLELDKRATCYPAEVTLTELICWCGHSLHLSSCADGGDCNMEEADHHGYCRNAWVELVWHMQHKDAPLIWTCPNEGQEHTAKLAVPKDGRDALVWCRTCASVTEVDMATGQLTDVTDR